MALFFFSLGLRGIITKKPFVVSSRWLFRCFVAAFTPFLFLPFAFHVPRDRDHLGMLVILSWLNPIMFLCVCVFMWLLLRGYLAFGVTDSSFREALLASLEKLDLPYEETVGALRLPSVGADLQLAVQSWIGTGRISVKQRQHHGLLENIVSCMNEHYRFLTVNMNPISCVLHIVMAIFMAVLAGGIYLAGTLLEKVA
jgi:hypothetical protein